MSSKLTRRDVSLLIAGMALGASGCEERQTGQGVGEKATAPPSATGSGAAGAGATPGVTDDTIKLGSWGPLSGPAAAWGAVLHGMNAYFTHINESGGIHGRKIEFIYRDDQYNPAKTPAVVRELVEKENVFAVISGIGTANGRSVADYLEKKGVPNFTPASGDKFWSQGIKKNVYTVFPRYLTEGELLGNYVAGVLGMKKIAVLYQNDDFGKQGLEGVKRGLGRHAGAKVEVELSVQPTDTDLSGQVSQIVEKAPDALIIFAGPKQGVIAVKMLHAQDKKPQVVTSFVLSDPILFKLGGEAWDGTISAAVAKLPDSDDETVKQYREILEKYGGGKLRPGTFTQAGFLFAMPFVEALERAGKTLTRANLMRAIQGLKDWKGPGPHFRGEGMGPPITFGIDRHLGNDQLYLVKAKEGHWEKLTDWMSLDQPLPESDGPESDGPKSDEAKSDEAKSDEAKSDESKSDEAKPAGSGAPKAAESAAAKP